MPGGCDQARTESGLEKWLEVNAELAKTWPNITQKKEPPADAKDFDGVPGKYDKYFSIQTRHRRLNFRLLESIIFRSCDAAILTLPAITAHFRASDSVRSHKSLIFAGNVLF